MTLHAGAHILLGALWCAAAGPVSAAGFDRLSGHRFAGRSEVIAPEAMAATSHPLATQVAVDILRAGGSAVDAAIAANAALCLMEPTGCGLGGDLFALVWDPDTERLHGLNASGRSPRNLTLDEFKRRDLQAIPSYGPLPVSVPGAVDGWFELHQRFGVLPMDRLLDPAIQYARAGFPVTELIAYYWAASARVLGDFPGFAETFLPDGRAPRKGERFRNPRLARTLERIATGGRDVFYRGDIARELVDDLATQGGFLTVEDLAGHRSDWVGPVSIDYRGYRVWELPPNGQGIAALQILNLLEPYDLRGMGFHSAEYVHLFVEAKKLAFEDRAAYYADPAAVEIPVEKLISDAYAERRRKLMDRDRASLSLPAGDGVLENGDTIYLTVADRHGSMVSLIQSNYRGMGSGITPGNLGFVLQNRGELFSLTPGHANVYAPGKRPFHTIIPGFVTRAGRPWLSFGVMGGAMQPQGHAQILINLIDFEMNLQAAGDAPRIRHEGSSQPTGQRMTDGGTVFLESGFGLSVRQDLLKMGHRIGESVGGFGGYQAIRWDPDQRVYIGASESRKDGQAAGY